MHLCFVAIDVVTESTLIFIQIDDAVYLPIFIPILSNLIWSENIHLRRSWIPHSWQPSHPALYCWLFTASPSPFLTCSPPGPTFLCLKPHSCPPLAWRCSVSPRLAFPFCTHCSLQSCFSTLPLTVTQKKKVATNLYSKPRNKQLKL